MEDKKRYSPEELAEFRLVIERKIKSARYELDQLKENINSFHRRPGSPHSCGTRCPRWRAA